MTNRRILFTEALFCAAFAILFYGAFIAPLMMFLGGMRYFLLSLPLVLFFFLPLALKRFKMNGFVYVLVQLALYAGLSFLMYAVGVSNAPLAAAAASFALSFFFSFAFHYSKHRDVSLALVLTAFGAFFIIGMVLAGNNIRFETALYMFLFLLLIIYVVQAQMKNIDSTLTTSVTDSRQPVKLLSAYNNRLLLIFVAAVSFIVLISRFLFLDKLLSGLLNLCLKGLKVFLRAVLKQEVYVPELPEAKLTPIETVDLSALSERTADRPPLIPVEVIYTVLGIVVIALFILLIYNMVKSFYLSFARVEYTSADKRERISREGMKTEKISPAFAPFLGAGMIFSQRIRIRRAFAKKVRKLLKTEVSAHETAGELAERMKSAEDVSELKERYDRARYGGML